MSWEAQDQSLKRQERLAGAGWSGQRKPFSGKTQPDGVLSCTRTCSTKWVGLSALPWQRKLALARPSPSLFGLTPKPLKTVPGVMVTVTSFVTQTEPNSQSIGAYA